MALVISALMACHPVSLERSLGATCDRDDDCQAAYVCELGACRSNCRVDADCPDGACLVVDRETRVCTVGAEQSCETGDTAACPPTFECAERACRNRCDENHACLSDRECISGACYDPT